MAEKKQNFLHGAALLAIATAIVKVIGALYKIPLNAIIGEQGFGYFYTAYDIYSVLLLISSAGLPVAMSRMLSAANSLGRYQQVRQIYRVSQTLFLALGAVGTLLMMLFCRQLAAFQEQPNAWFAIGCLGPCCFLSCLISAYRGYFQGLENMIPTSVSQVLEAFFKLIVGIAAAIVLLKLTNNVAYAAGGAILGVTVSCVISSFYLGGKFRGAYRRLPQSDEAPDSFSQTAKALMAIAIPITIGSAGLQLLSVLEAKLYMRQLLGTYTQTQADVMKGIYNMTQTIFNMPCAFIVPITISIIPAVTSNLTLHKFKAARAMEESSARITGLIAMPCAVGLLVLARPVTALLGGYTGEKLDLATSLMALQGVSILMYAVVQLTTAILQAHNLATLSVINMILSGLVRLIVVYVLTGIPSVGLLGAPIGAIVCYLLISVLNLTVLRHVVRRPPALTKNYLRSLLPALVMGVAVWLVYGILGKITTSRLVLCALPVLVGAAVYAVGAVLCRSITRRDCLLLPKGDKIANLLHLK